MAATDKNQTKYTQRDLGDCIRIPIKTSIEETIRILCGPPDITGIEIEEKPTHLDAALALKDPNPYVRAKFQVLSKLPAWKKREIEEIEQGKLPPNSAYDAFIKSVTKLGDKLGDTPSS